jgi:hypothetical protein
MMTRYLYDSSPDQDDAEAEKNRRKLLLRNRLKAITVPARKLRR